jgi:hypothetical protein
MSTISASTTTTTAFGVTADTTGTLVFQTGATPTTALTLDSSQNVGIGTTTPWAKLSVYGTSNQFASLTSPTGSSTQVGINLNPSMLVSEATNNPAQAAIYATDSNYSANIIFANKTAGALANSLTERMRIDNAGNVGIGTTSPKAKVQINPSSLANAGQWASAGLGVYNPTTVGTYSQLVFGYQDGTITNAASYIGYVSTNSGAQGYGDLVFGTRSVNTDTQPSERMRIDSSGNVGIGTSSPSALLSIKNSGMSSTILLGANAGSSTYGSISFSGSNSDGSRIGFTAGAAGNNNLYYDVPSSGNHIWRYGSGSTEAMRIDSSSNFLVGTTSSTNPANSVSYGTLINKTMFLGTAISAGATNFAGGSFMLTANWSSTGSSTVTIAGQAIYGNDNGAGMVLIVASNKQNPGKNGVLFCLWTKQRGSNPAVTTVSTFKTGNLTTLSVVVNAGTGNFDVSVDSDCAVTYQSLGAC